MSDGTPPIRSGRARSASFRAVAAPSAGGVLPVQFNQFRMEDFQTPEGIAAVNMQFAQLFTQFNNLLGSNGPSVLAAGVDVRGSVVTGLGAPQSPTDAISQAHAETTYSPAVASPQLDIGGKYALKGLSATYGMTTALQSQVNGFTTSTAASGHQTLPSGLVLQWGHSGTIATGAGTVVTFPVPFPTACFSVVATDDKAGGSNEAMAVVSISATSFTASAQGGSNGVWWQAIGQ